jgi:hypothetical protein
VYDYTHDENENEDEDEQGSSDESALSRYLKTMGISDPEKIKFENEKGDIEEINWDSLSEDEKFNILSTEQDNSELDLDDAEIDLINRIRLSNMSVDDFVRSIHQQGINQAKQAYE